MSSNRTKAFQLEAMRSLYASNRSARAILNHALRPNTMLGSRESTVDELRNVLTLEALSGISRRELVVALRRLDHAGAGKLFVGRRGRPSRFAWTQSPRDLGLTVIRPAGPPATPSAAKASAVTNADAHPALIGEEGGMCSYPFRLRRQLTVFLKLPADLSPNEAARLAFFVQSLPLDEPRSAQSGALDG
jgi:hypothetical protein